MTEVIENFHFMRPFWFFLVPVLLFSLYQKNLLLKQSMWEFHIAPHLLRAITITQKISRAAITDALTFLLMAIWVVALAGPSWKRVEAPFANQQAVLIIALELTPEMLRNDLKPNRLSHAKIKIQDILSRIKHEKVALIVYAESAHIVVPPTEDFKIIELYLRDLHPEIMPLQGLNISRAQQKSLSLIDESGFASQLLFIGSGSQNEWPPNYNNTQNMSFKRVSATNNTQSFYWKISADILPLPNALQYTVDDTDVRKLGRLLNNGLAESNNSMHDRQWQDAGYFLIFPVALLILPLMRIGMLI